jgi:hypothetical protein
MTHTPTACAPGVTRISALEALELTQQLVVEIAEELDLGQDADNEAILLAIHELKERAHPPAAEREVPGGAAFDAEDFTGILFAVQRDEISTGRAKEIITALLNGRDIEPMFPPANIGGDSPSEREKALRALFDAGFQHGYDAATAHEWGRKQEFTDNEAFQAALASLAIPAEGSSDA